MYGISYKKKTNNIFAEKSVSEQKLRSILNKDNYEFGYISKITTSQFCSPILYCEIEMTPEDYIGNYGTFLQMYGPLNEFDKYVIHLMNSKDKK